MIQRTGQLHGQEVKSGEAGWILPRCMECIRGLAMRIRSVCLSVCPSNAWIVTKRERNLQRFLYRTKHHLARSSGNKNGCWGTLLLPEILVNRRRWREIDDFEQLIARSASAVTPSEKSSINTNRKSTTRLPMSQRWSSYVAPKPLKGGSKTQNGHYSSKIALCLKKVCYKVSLCENCQRQCCKASIVLTIGAKNNCWGTTPSTWNFGLKWPRWSEIVHFRSIFS